MAYGNREQSMRLPGWEDLPPTPRQTLAIARLCMALKIRPELEHLPRNRREARNMMYDLRNKLRGLAYANAEARERERLSGT